MPKRLNGLVARGTAALGLVLCAALTLAQGLPMPEATEANRLLSEGRPTEAVPHAERALAAAGRALAADDPLQAFFLLAAQPPRQRVPGQNFGNGQVPNHGWCWILVPVRIEWLL